MSSVDEIIKLHSENKLTYGSTFRFVFVKNNRKFKIKVIYYCNVNLEIRAAYEGYICPNDFCEIWKLKDKVENIDKEFSHYFKPIIKIKGPMIYGGGHGTGHDCGCCMGGYPMIYEVKDINQPWSHENRQVTSCYID